MNIIAINGSPKNNGNTAKLITWFAEGARTGGSTVRIVHAATLKTKTSGCLSCRLCQKRTAYGCIIQDEVSDLLMEINKADIIVMATPLYFFSASAQIKGIFDRMFSLYKWDNTAGTMKTVLKGKTMVLLASAYEAVGLEALERPFVLTAEYTGMKYASLLVPDAGESGDIVHCAGVREKAAALGAKITAIK